MENKVHYDSIIDIVRNTFAHNIGAHRHNRGNSGTYHKDQLKEHKIDRNGERQDNVGGVYKT